MINGLRDRISLSERLLMSAGMVSKGNVVADVGCDHAHTCIWLIKNGVVDSAIAMDVRKGPLDKAKANIDLYGLSNKIELRLSDGLDALTKGEADSIIIAGMGGTLTEQILKKGLEKAVAARELILQPQSDIGLVRRFLREHGFRITDEKMCIESGKFYNSMRAVPIDDNVGGQNLTYSLETEMFDEYGEILLNGKNEVLKEFLQVLLRKNERNLKQLGDGGNERALDKKRALMHEKELIELALGRF